MAEGTVNLPAGFVLEDNSPQQSTVNLPAGFVLESPESQSVKQSTTNQQDSLLGSAIDKTVRALSGAGTEISSTIKGLADLPHLFRDPETKDELKVAKATGSPLTLAIYRLGKGFYDQLAEAKAARDKARAEGEGLGGQTLVTLERYPIVGDLVQMLERGESAEAIGQGITRALILRGLPNKTASETASVTERSGIANRISKAVGSTPVEKLAAATNPKSGRFLESAERSLPELERIAQGKPSTFADSVPASSPVTSSVESSVIPAASTSSEISSAIAARNARSELGSTASTVPERVLGKPNRLVDEIGSQAATLPESVIGPKLKAMEKVAEPAIEPMRMIANGATSPRDLAGLIKVTTGAGEQLEQIFQSVIRPIRQVRVDVTPIADAMERTISRYVEARYPKIATKIREDAKFYRGKHVTLDELDDFRRGVNDELDAFYAKNNLKRSVARKDPQVAYREAEVNAIRETEYDAIQQATGKDMRSLKKLQSDITEIREVAQSNFDRLTLKDARLRGQSLTKKFWDAAEHAVSSHPLAGVRMFADAIFNRGSRELKTSNKAARKLFAPSKPSRVGPISRKAATTTGRLGEVLSGREIDEQ